MSKSSPVLESKYEGFTLALALVDAVPVLFFGASCVLIGLIFKSPLFIIGAFLCFFAGFGKVLWKTLLALTHKDIALLNRQFRFTMTGGFILIIISVVINYKRVSIPGIISSVTSVPSLYYFVIWITGMVAMIVLGKKLDSNIAKNNWIEQSVNSLAQISLFVMLLGIFKGV